MSGRTVKLSATLLDVLRVINGDGLSLKSEDRIQTRHRRYQAGNRVLETHYFTRYIHDKSELWIFCSGLGDQAMMQQIGDTFLSMSDPELGKIMVGMGNGVPVREMWRGDFSVVYPFATTVENWHHKHFATLNYAPDLVMATSTKILEDVAEFTGYPTMRFRPGIGRFFKPLYKKRKGYGFAGLDNKNPDDTHAILGWIKDDPEFEWISKSGITEDDFLTLPELNEWYNSKKIIFGIQNTERVSFGYVPSRIYESIASGTPLVTTANPQIEEALEFKYPYQSKGYDHTRELVCDILDNYQQATKTLDDMSRMVLEKHSYVKRLNNLFEKLRSL